MQNNSFFVLHFYWIKARRQWQSWVAVQVLLTCVHLVGGTSRLLNFL